MRRNSQPVALAHTGSSGAQGVTHAQEAPLPRRLFLEVLITLVAAVIVVAATLGLQERSRAHASTPPVSYGINTGSDPQQVHVGSFQQTIYENGTRAEIRGDYTYTISARVQSTHAYNDDISAVIPYDFLLGWGDMADDSLASKLTWEQADRRGMVSGTIGGSDGANITTDYVISHVSNNHLIPASDSIRKALAMVRPGDIVRIDGRLVDVKAFVKQSRALMVSTSKSRTDEGDGACEIIYVEQLKINGETFLN